MSESGIGQNAGLPSSSKPLAGRRIDICAPPYAGHLYPLIPLGRRLAWEGASVQFITGIQKGELLSSLGFRVAALLLDRVDDLAAYSDPKAPIWMNPWRQLRQLQFGLQLLIDAKPSMIQMLEANRPDILIADSITVLPGVVCETLGIPYITSVVTPFSIESHKGTPSFLGGWRESKTAVGRARDWLGRKAVRGAKRAAFALCAAQVRALGLPSPYRRDGSEAILSPYSIVGLGVSELEFARDWPPHFRMIGPVLETPEAKQWGRLRWPDARRRILLSVGTHLSRLKPDLVTSVCKLLDAFPEHLFCISLGKADRWALDPVQTGPNWATYPYIPYSSELANFDVVIHHGGAGATYSCLAAGRPSLVVPQDFDQFDFARRIEAKGLGISVKSLSSDQAVIALRELLQPRWQEPLAAMARTIARYRPEDAIVSEVSRVLTEHA